MRKRIKDFIKVIIVLGTCTIGALIMYILEGI